MTPPTDAERKRNQREKIRAWLEQNTPVLSSDALVMLLLKLDEKSLHKFRMLVITAEATETAAKLRRMKSKS